METDKPKNKGGRPVGAANKLAMEARQRAQETGELPHEFLLRVARGEYITRQAMNPVSGKVESVEEVYDFEARKDAAKAAAPYFAPKLSTVEMIRGVQDDELDAIIKELASQTGFSLGPSGEVQADEAEGGEGVKPARSRVKLL